MLARLLEVNDEPMVQAGLERTTIEKRFEGVGLGPPAELVRMYELHDGIFHLNAFLHFLPLSEAIENYARYAEISSQGGLPAGVPGFSRCLISMATFRYA